MRKLFGKLFRQPVILSASKPNEISNLSFLALLSSHWNPSQSEHIIEG